MMIFNLENNENLSRKERERLFRRREILLAASKLFAVDGYEQTTIEHIAEAAEYGKGTIYNYFESKEEIYITIIDEVFTEHLRQVEAINAQTATLKEFIRKMTRTLFEFSIKYKYAFIILVRMRTKNIENCPGSASSKPDKRLKRIKEIADHRIENAVKNGEIRNIEATALFNVYRSMIFPFITYKMFCEKQDNIDIEENTELITSIFFDGISKK